ncbi:MAG TPA: DUF5063 domain-containing protein [Gammaproteobacteria bacterium]|nr:DUF5063 domain-containing protein [Gammaproteobacteria bacterium]
MKSMPLQCGRMAAVAREYCTLIDEVQEAGWMQRLDKLLPRLHVAVTALSAPTGVGQACLSYDDEQRCELFLSLSALLQADRQLGQACAQMPVGPQRRQQLCERMADNLTDMYFDLKYGLKLLELDPQRAADNWQYSFYTHWGKHLLDAECWLRAVESGSEPVPLPAWRWPSVGGGPLPNPA